MRILFLVLTISLAFIAVTFASENIAPWQMVGDGISYQEYHLSTPEPVDIYVARLDRANPNAILDSAVGQGRISYGTEKVTDMVKRYDDSINYWGNSWGNRSQVVVAINGSYYNSIGAPESGQILSGWYAKRFTNLSSSSGFAFFTNRLVSIGQCVNNDPAKQLVSIYRQGQETGTFRIDGLNVPRGSSQLILYTPQYDSFTHTNNDGVEILVEMKRPTLLLPSPQYASGVVRKIMDKKGRALIPFDHIVLSASGAARGGLLGAVQVEDEVRISQEITPYDRDCQSAYPMDWTKAYASISGDFTVLRDGQIISSNPKNQPGAFAKHPRTAIAYNDQYVYFIVVDGRTSRSVGMTFDEVASFAKNALGATWAIMQDGGGSSVMLVNGQIKNHPVSTCNAVFLPYITGGSAPPDATPMPPQATPSATARPLASLYTCERPVANSMMMIAVQPAQWSLAYRSGEIVRTVKEAEVRLGPGSNYAVISTLPAGIEGSIQSSTSNLSGILAKGAYWWKVSFGSLEGWVDENAIANH